MKKPIAKLIGADGNIFNLVGIAAKALRKAGQEDQVSEMRKKVMKSKSYDQALQVIMDYVNVRWEDPDNIINNKNVGRSWKTSLFSIYNRCQTLYNDLVKVIKLISQKYIIRRNAEWMKFYTLLLNRIKMGFM